MTESRLRPQLSHPFALRHVFAVLSVFLLLGFTFATTGCASQGVMQDDVSPRIADEIPEGANRVVIDRLIGEYDELDDVAMALYTDARERLSAAGFTLVQDDPENLVLVTEPMDIENELALRISANVDITPGGSRLVASSDWADDVYNPDWKEAKWTSGMEKEAFERTLNVLQDIEFDEFSTSVE